MPTSKAQQRASIKYAREKLKRIPLDVQKSQYDEIKAHSEACGESVNGFIKRAIQMTMERDKAATEAQSAPQEDKT